MKGTIKDTFERTKAKTLGSTEAGAAPCSLQKLDLKQPYTVVAKEIEAVRKVDIAFVTISHTPLRHPIASKGYTHTAVPALSTVSCHPEAFTDPNKCCLGSEEDPFVGLVPH